MGRGEWPNYLDYCSGLEDLTRDIIREGPDSREFEQKTPLNERHAIMLSMVAFNNPVLLEYKRDCLPDGLTSVLYLGLRGLAP